MENQFKKAHSGENGTTIHFAYLFASPLVIDAEGKYHEDILDEISYK